MENENKNNGTQDVQDDLGVDKLLSDAGVDMGDEDKSHATPDKMDTPPKDDQVPDTDDKSRKDAGIDDDVLEGDDVPEDDSFDAKSIYPNLDEILGKTDDKTDKTDKGKTKDGAVQDDAPPSEDDEKARDYEIFKDLFEGVDPKIFKGTRNSVFNALKEKIVPEIRSLREKVSNSEDVTKRINSGQYAESFYSHPQAYLLTPEYTRAAREVSIADFEESQHRASLRALRDKDVKDVRIFTGYDGQGNAQYTSVDVSDDNTRDELRRDLETTLTQVATHRQNFNGVMNQVAARHNMRNQQLNHMITDLEQKRLGRYLKSDNPRAKEIKGFLDSLPPELRAERLAGPISKMYGYLIDMSIQVKQLKQQLSQTKIAKEDEKRAEPGSRGRVTSKKGGEDLVLKWDDDME